MDYQEAQEGLKIFCSLGTQQYAYMRLIQPQQSWKKPHLNQRNDHQYYPGMHGSMIEHVLKKILPC